MIAAKHNGGRRVCQHPNGGVFHRPMKKGGRLVATPFSRTIVKDNGTDQASTAGAAFGASLGMTRFFSVMRAALPVRPRR